MATANGRTRGRLRLASLVAAVPSPARTPFTFWYLAVLLVTTVILRSVDEPVAARLLALSSTDAHNLQHDPLLVLATSALWLSDAHWVAYAAIFAVAIAPLERRIGAAWTAMIFVSGHVLATLATELPVLLAVHAHLLPHSAAHLLDVGVSYGFFATSGALLLMLPTSARRVALLAVTTSIVAIYMADDPASLDSLVTFVGHLLAVLIGLLGWSKWLRRRDLVGSLRPFRPAEVTEPIEAPAAREAPPVPVG